MKPSFAVSMARNAARSSRRESLSLRWAMTMRAMRRRRFAEAYFLRLSTMSSSVSDSIVPSDLGFAAAS